MMKKKGTKGFTLVELLVVMAIIAILASIVVPNLATWIGRGRVTRAVSEIESMELALSAMLADTERSSLNDLFNPAGVEAYLSQISPTPTPDRWKAAQQMYTRATYALLRDGRGVLNQTDTGSAPYPNFLYAGAAGGVTDAGVLRQNLVKKLGTNYLPEIGFDPFGKLYNIFPGPWNFKDGDIVFRVYQQASGSDGQTLPGKSQSLQTDALNIGEVVGGTQTERLVDQETGIVLDIGYPATTRKAFYIWSSGANGISGQAVYDPGPNPGGTGNVQYDTTNSNLSYDPTLEPVQMGGGDDINNWDSGSSWQSFYN